MICGNVKNIAMICGNVKKPTHLPLFAGNVKKCWIKFPYLREMHNYRPKTSCNSTILSGLKSNSFVGTKFVKMLNNPPLIAFSSHFSVFLSFYFCLFIILFRWPPSSHHHLYLCPTTTSHTYISVRPTLNPTYISVRPTLIYL